MSQRPSTSRRELRPVFAGLMLAMLLAALDHTVVATALPTIVGELGDLAQLPMVVTAYLLAATVSVPLLGRLSDVFGRTRMFHVAIGLFVLGALASGAAQSLGWLVAARVVQGAGAGGVIALTQTTIADLVTPRERGRYHGLMGAVFGFASIVGPLLGGLFVDHLSWRFAFWLNVPLGLLAMVVLARLLRLAPTGERRRVDWLGATLLVAGVSGLLLAVATAGREGAVDTRLALLAAGSVTLLVGFVVAQRYVTEPFVPLGLFRNRVFATGSALMFVVGVGMFSTIIYTPLYLQAVLGASATASGLLLLPLLGGLIASTIVSGRLVSRWGRYKPFPVAGTALLTLGLWLLSRLPGEASITATALPLAVAGVGIGMTLQIVVLAVQNAVDTVDLGTATSLTQFFRTIGGTLGVAGFGALLTARTAASLSGALPAGTDLSTLLASPAGIAALEPATREVVRAALADGTMALFAAAVPIVAVGFLLALVLPERPLRDTVDDA